MPAFMYILECSDSTYYTGSTINIEKRIHEHQSGYGANYTKQKRPVRLVYYEEFQYIKDAFLREKQIQGWNRKKKTALIKGQNEILTLLSKCNKSNTESNELHSED